MNCDEALFPSLSTQPVFSFDVFELQSTDSGIQSPAVGHANNDGDLIRQWRIVERDGHAVIMRSHIKGVFAGERNINGCPRSASLGHGRDPRLSAANGLPEWVCECGGEQSVDV